MIENQRYKKGCKEVDVARLTLLQSPSWTIVDRNATRNAKNIRHPNDIEGILTLEQLQKKFTPHESNDKPNKVTPRNTKENTKERVKNSKIKATSAIN